jgi:BirA family biotin operon repressor/biotin-[acetyl-CoA-carboxylase] ligase
LYVQNKCNKENLLIGREMHFFEIIDTTQDYLKKNHNHFAEGLTVIASNMTKGKGRKNKNFFSPEKGLYMSVLLKPKNVKNLNFIVIYASVAVCEAIYETYGIEVDIKWVNDIFCFGKKICGILVESIFKNEKEVSAIVGFGINTNSDLKNFPSEIKDKVSTLFECTGIRIKNEEIAFRVLKNFNKIYAYYKKNKNKDILTKYKKRNFILKKNIKVIENENSYIAKAVDLDEFGRLVIMKGKEIKILDSEEVSLDII